MATELIKEHIQKSKFNRADDTFIDASYTKYVYRVDGEEDLTELRRRVHAWLMQNALVDGSDRQHQQKHKELLNLSYTLHKYNLQYYKLEVESTDTLPTEYVLMITK